MGLGGGKFYIGDGGYDSRFLFFSTGICGSCLFYPMGFVSNLVFHIFFSLPVLLFFFFYLFVSENILVCQFTQ